MLFANIIVDISHEKLDKTFQYIVPERMEKEVKVGCFVDIPFGKGDRCISGYVIELVDTPCMDMARLKEIRSIRKDAVIAESQLIELAWFIKERYGSTMNRALKTVLPVKQSVKNREKKFLRLRVPREEAFSLYEEYRKKKNLTARATLLRELLNSEEIEYQVAVEKLAVSASVIKGLEKSRVIEVIRTTLYRNPVGDYGVEEEQLILNEEQKAVADSIKSEIGRGNHGSHLIFGVTGSGKTQVYMDIISYVISMNREVIVLIPEISLTYQTIKRFYRRFGSIVSIINSKLSKGEKYDQFERAKKGDIKIMIGPRSALFTPFHHLGLILIDEEHESAYKSDSVPKYHAREVAIERARQCGATVVLGSATPSVTTYYQALNGHYHLHILKNRANRMTLPKVDIVDMRTELENGNREMFSESLKELISDRLSKKQQTMLFINRRGYSSFVSCRKCGNPIKCPHCDVSLTLHKNIHLEESMARGDRLVCHYCGYSMQMPKGCPSCGSKYIGRFGIGTEQIEEKIKEMYPQAKVLRMDMDTTRGKDDYEHILTAFAGGEADILVGTQMIVKGHDFGNVTLVGIIAADLSVFAPDYTAAERTFQLLTQAAGRAGRGNIEGNVIIQTYHPEEMCIQTAARQNYEEFYENEIAYRKLMTYPPVYDMMAVLITHENEEFVYRAVSDVAQRIEKSKIAGLTVIGPAKAAVSKINDIYRYVIYLKHENGDTLIKIKNAIIRYIDRVEEYKNLTIQFDFNPISAL